MITDQNAQITNQQWLAIISPEECTSVLKYIKNYQKDNETEWLRAKHKDYYWVNRGEKPSCPICDFIIGIRALENRIKKKLHTCPRCGAVVLLKRDLAKQTEE